MPGPLAQLPSCAALHSRPTRPLVQSCRPAKLRKAFRCRAKPDAATTEKRSKKAAPSDKTEQQAESEAEDIVEKTKAEGEDAKAEKVGDEVKITKGGGDKIYIGFKKGDTDRSKAGRLIDDDPSRYPDRTQTTGGWSGGEKGLQAFIEKEQKELAAGKAVVKGDQKQGNNKPVVLDKDGETIYIGFEKEDYAGKRAGGAGRTIQADPAQYPSREGMLTGGFAGGEAGLQSFLQEGKIQFKDPDNSSNNFNILAFAGLLAIATTVGGILLTNAVDVGEENVKGVSAQLQQLTSQPVDENSKLLLQVVLALFGVTAVGVVIRTFLKSVAGKVTRGSLNVAKLAVFWTGVFVAARFILESN